jgi:hypothetical protein
MHSSRVHLPLLFYWLKAPCAFSGIEVGGFVGRRAKGVAFARWASRVGAHRVRPGWRRAEGVAFARWARRVAAHRVRRVVAGRVGSIA